MDLGYIVGWIGVGLGIAVPIPQLIKIKKTSKLEGISIGTYSFLMATLVCYLIHAIHIGSEVFMTAQAINLSTNGLILGILMKNRKR